MAAILRISDGTTTLNLIGDTDGYKLIYKSWAPKRAHYNPGLMGGSPFGEVDENPIAIAISGTSTSQVLSRYDALSNLLYKAEIWGTSGQGDAVKLQYLPEGSALGSPVEAVIVSPASRRDIIVPPPNFTDATYGGRLLSPVVLNLRRRGLWLGTTEAISSVADLLNPFKYGIGPFTDAADIAVPYDIKIKVNRSSGHAAYTDVFALFQNEADKLYLIEGEDLSLSATGGAWTTPANTAASGDNVARYTFSGSTQTGEAGDSSPGIDSNATTMAFFCVADNDTGSDLILQMQMRGVGTNLVSGRRTIIDSGNTSPQIYNLGILATQSPIDYIELNLNAADGTESVSGTLDIDYLCGIVIDSNSHIIRFIDVLDEDTDVDLYIEHRQDDALVPLVYETTSGSGTKTNYPSYEGSASIFMNGLYVIALVFGVDRAGEYLIDNGSGTVPAGITVTATKTLAYLTPV